jgi:hypothetical protein
LRRAEEMRRGKEHSRVPTDKWMWLAPVDPSSKFLAKKQTNRQQMAEEFLRATCNDMHFDLISTV